jgi:hypothetical protein
MKEGEPGPHASSEATEARTPLWHIAVSGSAATVAYVLLIVLSRPTVRRGRLRLCGALALGASLSGDCCICGTRLAMLYPT